MCLLFVLLLCRCTRSPLNVLIATVVLSGIALFVVASYIQTRYLEKSDRGRGVNHVSSELFCSTDCSVLQSLVSALDDWIQSCCLVIACALSCFV